MFHSVKTFRISNYRYFSKTKLNAYFGYLFKSMRYGKLVRPYLCSVLPCLYCQHTTLSLYLYANAPVPQWRNRLSLHIVNNHCTEESK